MKIQRYSSFISEGDFTRGLKRLFMGPDHKQLGKDIAAKVEKFLKGETDSKVEMIGKINRYNLSDYGDFKMTISLKIEGEKFLIEVIKKPSWKLVVNNVKYDVYSGTCRNLWYLLDKYERQNKFKVDKISKFFK
jgi:hypothetical protein